jgi:hypothetical protein
VRPTSRPQSALRCPLNHVLGAEANVRVLRVVLLSDIPIGVPELARLAALQVSGVARVCTRLEDLGVIEAVGRGARHRQFRRGGRADLVKQLTALFTKERAHAERAVDEVREAVLGGSPEIRAAWIEGPVALGTDRPADALVVGVVVEPAGVDAVRRDLWPRLLAIQARGDVVVELRVLTSADLRTADAPRRAELEHVLPLSGPPPLDLIRTEPPRGRGARDPRGKRHADLEARSLAIARIIADRVRHDPSLVEDARRHLERRMPSASPGERLELQEWQSTLATMSIPRLRRFLVQDDARGRRLRQSSPFLAALSPDERRALFAAAERAT